MTSSSFAPEQNQAAGRPRFNGDPNTIFEGGTVPAGWQTTEPGAATAPGASTALKGVVVTNPGSGLDDGSASGVAVTNISSSGTGGKVDYVISSGQVQSATVTTAGSGYAQDDTLGITGLADVVLTASITGG